MHVKIKFDNANPDWQKDESFRKFYIRARLDQLMDRYKFIGYLYFSTIHDYFNLVWDPYNENRCFIYERDKDLKIDISDGEAGEYVINISA